MRPTWRCSLRTHLSSTSCGVSTTMPRNSSLHARAGDRESLPRSALGLTVHQLVDNCFIQLTLTCPEVLFMGPPTKFPGAPTPATTRAGQPTATGPQPTSNALIPPLCQKVVASFNQLYPALTFQNLCTQKKVKFVLLKIGRIGACVNFSLLGRCQGCIYRHKVCSLSNSHQAAVVKVLESTMATMKAATVP
jgi:hypothetical protein